MKKQEIIESNKFICTYCGIDPIKDFCKNPKECYTKKKVEFTIEEPSAVSAEEMLNKFVGIYVDDNVDKVYLKSDVLKAMQEYANASMRANQWISVDERLPEKIGFYLVIVDDSVASKYKGKVEIGECFKSVDTKGLFEILKFHDYVTHWMPLPELP